MARAQLDRQAQRDEGPTSAGVGRALESRVQPAEAPTTHSGRDAYIDWARGIAVLLMIEAHALDAWTHPAARRGPWFRDAAIAGGFAAPLFLWLAGLGVVIAATRAFGRAPDRWAAAESVCRRGTQIFLL